MKLSSVLFSALPFLFAVSQVVHAGVRGDYKAPLFVVPYAATAPKIDGIVDDAEWQNALSIDALQTTEGKLSVRPTRFWLMWDEDHLYIAMRSPLRAGERVVQAFRQTGRDVNSAVFDDSYEIWINANTTSPDGQRVFFQYLGNYPGARYDVMFEPAVGNSRPGWTSGWKPVGRITPDGKAWELEVAIPRQSIYRTTPWADGDELKALIVRSFKRPWEQNSIGGSGSFSAGDTHSRLVLSRHAPAIQLLGVSDVSHDSLGIALAASSQEPKRLSWTFQSDGGVSKMGELIIPAGKSASIEPQLGLDQVGKGDYRIRVSSTDGKTTYLDWCSRREFGDRAALTEKLADTGDQMAMTLLFNPVKNYVRVDGDLINYDKRAEIARYHAEVLDAKGNTLVEKDLTLDSLAYVKGLLDMGECAPGQYVAKLTCYDAQGKPLFERRNEFAKKDAAKAFPWWNTKVGNIEKVIAPWTAVRYDADKFHVWGRSMQMGADGLIQQVTAQGQDLLAAPATIEATLATGKVLPTGVSEPKVVSSADHRVVVDRACQLGDLDIASHVTCEFDGMYKVAMTLTPRKPVTVESLKIRVPLRPEVAQYYHASGEGIRYGFSYGYVPADKQGKLWDCLAVDGQPMVAGSFIPFMWVGNDKAGLSWFADSDEGWVPSGKTPAIELRRDSADRVDLVLNLIGETFTIDKPRTITFAFQATPVKPMQKGWRMDTWGTGDSFKDWSQLESEGHAGNMGLIFSALPFPLNPAKSREMADARHKETAHFGLPKYRANAVPYFENVLTTESRERFSPDIKYFSDPWRARVSDALCWDKTSTDYIVWNLDKWCADSDIDGWYIDNVRPIACDNIDAGRGYRLPDGRVQPTYQIFDTREAFLRIRAMFAEHGKSGKFVLHMTNNFVIPWLGAADLALDGEDHVIFPEMGKDFIDFWSLDRMRLDYWRQWGVAVTFLQEYQGKWNPDDMRRVMRAYTGMSILHDVHPGANPNGNNPEVWQARDRFGIEADDVTFVPYWQPNSGLIASGEGIRASAWVRPGKLLIAVVNLAEKTQGQIQIDCGKLGLAKPAACRAIDAETNEVLKLSEDGQLELPVQRHGYRQILIEGVK